MIIEIPFFGRVSNEWLISRTAGKLFAASAFIVVAETPVIVVSRIPETVSGNVFQALMGAAGALSLFFIWLGMWTYWVRIDKSRPAVKRLSFFVLLLGFWYGAILYFLYQYLWIDGRKRRAGERANESV